MAGAVSAEGVPPAEMRAMLGRLLAVLDAALTDLERRIAATHAEGDGGDGGSGAGAGFDLKAVLDAVSVITRTIEKVEQLLRTLSQGADGTDDGTVSDAERAALSRRLERWIDERADARLSERLVAERLAGEGAEPSSDAGHDVDG